MATSVLQLKPDPGANMVGPDNIVGPDSNAVDCTICGASEWSYAVHSEGCTYYSCDCCGFVRLQPQSHPRGNLHARDHSKGVETGVSTAPNTTDSESSTGNHIGVYWESLTRELPVPAAEARVLIVAPSSAAVAAAGAQFGYGVTAEVGIESGKLVSLVQTEPNSFDAALVVDALERSEDPKKLLRDLHRMLKPSGILCLASPLLSSSGVGPLKNIWPEHNSDNRSLFSWDTIQSALLDTGFHGIELTALRRPRTLEQLYQRARRYAGPRMLYRSVLLRSMQGVVGVLPASLRNRIALTLPSSRHLVIARKRDLSSRPLLSIVMPVFNERATFKECFDVVYAKSVSGVDKEIIIVESNSTDGTKELVQQIAVLPGVRVLFQERPRGKGNAVRAGLEMARGDVVLIQDADLEYDVEDYDALIRPLLHYRAAFVLGSRHSASWKMREFNDQPVVASFFNVGHLIFLTLFNLVMGQSLKDPFTMYKVFRRDCLHGLSFECNRFDFDFEIVMKLIRKGYTPIEIPVNYKARSLNEGKKVSAFSDPWTWLRALVKYRFCRL